MTPKAILHALNAIYKAWCESPSRSEEEKALEEGALWLWQFADADTKALHLNTVRNSWWPGWLRTAEV